MRGGGAMPGADGSRGVCMVGPERQRTMPAVAEACGNAGGGPEPC